MLVRAPGVARASARAGVVSVQREHRRSAAAADIDSDERVAASVQGPQMRDLARASPLSPESADQSSGRREQPKCVTRGGIAHHDVPIGQSSGADDGREHVVRVGRTFAECEQRRAAYGPLRRCLTEPGLGDEHGSQPDCMCAVSHR